MDDFTQKKGLGGIWLSEKSSDAGWFRKITFPCENMNDLTQRRRKV